MPTTSLFEQGKNIHPRMLKLDLRESHKFIVNSGIRPQTTFFDSLEIAETQKKKNSALLLDAVNFLFCCGKDLLQTLINPFLFELFFRNTSR